MQHKTEMTSKLVLNKDQYPVFEKVKGIIFDLDGVLVDTAVFHFKAWKKLAHELGFDFTEKQNEQLKGVSRMESLALILSWGQIQKSKEEQVLLAEWKNRQYLKLVSEMNANDVLPGVLSLLNYLNYKQYKIALGSASKNATLILEKTGLSSYFDVIIDGNQVLSSKPDPEVFLKGARAMHVHPNECLVIEDAQSGIEAARRAGMSVIGVGKLTDLQGADYLINNLQELLI